MNDQTNNSLSRNGEHDAGNNARGATNGKRKKAMLAAAAIFGAIAIGYGAYWVLHGRFFESTDDAYVAGNVVVVTPQIAGTVIAIEADDTDFVRAGRVLVVLDRSDAKVALDQTEAALAQQVRQARSLFVTNASLAANVDLAKSQLAKANEDMNRRRNLGKTGAVSLEELHHAETAVKSAQADLLAAQEKLATNRAFTQNTSIENHPSVAQAAAKVREAYLAYQRATIPAAVDGYVAKRAVQVGQRVAPGTPLMAIVPLHEVWVDANFKEGQLADMRIGQPVQLEADIYGGKVEYHGKIVGLGAGTGSAFSLLPAQNATGNWIKVVQRVPVRISIDPQELAQHPLRIGLSMIATVDHHDRSGAQLMSVPRSVAAYKTDVYNSLNTEADALVKKIILDNRGDAIGENSAVQHRERSRSKNAALAHID